MKTRIVIFLILSVIWMLFCSLVVPPVTVIAKNVATVATVNGGDMAYVTQHALNQLNVSVGVGLLMLLILCFAGPIWAALNRS